MRIERKDVFNIANAMSASGGITAVHGATIIDTPRGIFEVAIGRGLDLVDGPYARMTGTDSEFGAIVDATLDKIASLAIVVAEWKKNIAPKPALAAIVTQNTVNALATTATKLHNPEADLSPTKDGKYAMYAQNLALGSYAVANQFEKGTTLHSVFRLFGHTATTVGVGYFGIRATKAYIDRARS